MAYKVLYRKYRPKTFSDVVGQNQITNTLKNEVISQRLAHAYLFTGSRGTGKTTCAKILAKAVNCTNPQNGDPCGECANCIGIENGSIMDVMEIDAASNNRVDDVRTLIEEVAFTPATAKFRVYIIDEVHELSASAFNALLKTLEEPPEHAIFILATTEVHKLLTTILSRCQRFDFRRITSEDIALRLEYIAKMENVSVWHEAALMIARIADGGMRDAISIFDQCIARSNEVTCKIVEDTAGVVSRENLFTLCNSILEADCAKAISIIAKMHESSKDLSNLCEELIMQFRHLMLIKTMGDKSGMILMSEFELESLKEQAVNMPLSLIIHSLDSFQKTLDKMKYVNQRIELEMIFIKLCSPELDTSAEALLRRIEALEQRKVIASNEAVVKAIPTQKPVVVSDAPSPTAPSPIVSNKTDIHSNATVFKDWAEVVHIIKDYSKMVGMAFNSSSAYVSGDYMLIDGSEMAFDYLRTNPVYKDKLREAILTVTGKNYKLGPYKGEKIQQEKSDPYKQLADKALEAGIEVKNINAML